MVIDKEYLERIYNFFCKNQGKKYALTDLSNDHTKFINHVKHYIDTRHCRKVYVDVSFNNEYNYITIHYKL